MPFLSPRALRYRNGVVCKCGAKKIRGSRSCRECFRAGRGVTPGRKGSSLGALLEKAKKLKKGESITEGGLTLTKK